MTQRILRAKHWQILLLIAGPAMAISFIMQPAELREFPPTIPLEERIQLMLGPSLIFSVWMLGTWGAWFWHTAKGLRPFAPEDSHYHAKAFNLSLIYVVVYPPLFLYLNLFQFAQGTGVPGTDYMLLWAPLHFLCMACLFYLSYTVARLLNSAENKEEYLRITDYIKDIFLLLMFPIGIWFIQPRINRLVKTEE